MVTAAHKSRNSSNIIESCFALAVVALCTSIRGVNAFTPLQPGNFMPRLSYVYQPRQNVGQTPIPSRKYPQSTPSTAVLPASSKGEEASIQERVFKSFLKGLWKGVTIPFPVLQKVVGRSDSNGSMGINLGLREGFLFLLAYLAVGVAGYSYLFEKFSIVDALYFSTVCFSTVGYGDVCPQTKAGMTFTCLYGLSGIAFLGTAVATICSSIVQAEKEAAKQVKEVGQKRIKGLFSSMPSKVKKLKSSKKENNKIPPEVVQEMKPTTTVCNTKRNRVKRKAGSVFLAVKQYLPSIFVIFSGGIIIGKLDGWNFLESIYYAVITASTIGFGDISPQSRAARICAIVFIPLSVAAAGELLSRAATALIERRQRKAYQKQVEGGLTLEHLTAMDANDDGQVSREEYVYFMLKEMGLVAQEELDELIRQFDKLDASKSGSLDHDDLVLLAEMRGATVKK